MAGHLHGRDAVRLGIIGTGLAVEQLHWPALKRMRDQFPITAFCDIDRANAEHFSSYSGTPMSAFTADYNELLARDDVDAVLISLPIELNYPVSKAAVEEGKHVICEKPSGANDAEGCAFVDLEAQHPELTILIAENWFYRDDLRLARQLLDEERIGRLHLVTWRYVSQLIPREGQFSSTPWRQDAKYVGGPHLDGGVHQFAQIRLLCGDIDRLAGETQDANSIFAGPSDLTLTLRFVNGASGSYAASYPEIAVPSEANDMRLYGTNGVMTLGQSKITIQDAWGTIDTYRIEAFDGGYYNEFLNFYQALTGGEPIVATVAQNYRNMEFVLRGLESAATGQACTIEPWPLPLSPTAVPLWRPAGAPSLFDDPSTTITHDTTKAS
jgi:predicted dehydrogenase